MWVPLVFGKGRIVFSVQIFFAFKKFFYSIENEPPKLQFDCGFIQGSSKHVRKIANFIGGNPRSGLEKEVDRIFCSLKSN